MSPGTHFQLKGLLPGELGAATALDPSLQDPGILMLYLSSYQEGNISDLDKWE